MVASAASVSSIPMICPRRAPIALSSPSSRRRSVMMAENSTPTISAVLMNMTSRSASTPLEQRRQAVADGGEHGFAGDDLDGGEIRQDCEANLLRGGAGRKLDQHAGQLVGLQRRLLSADLLHGLAQIVQRRERDEKPSLVSADRGFSELSVDDERLAEEQQLRAERFVPAPADDDVAGLQRPVEAPLQPWLDREVARGIEGDEVDGFVAMPVPIARGFGAKDQLRSYAPDALEARQPTEHVVVERQVGRLRGQQSRRDVGQRSAGNDEHVRPQAGEADVHAALDAAHEHRAGEDRAGADRHRGQQQQRAGLAASEILQRKASQQEPDARSAGAGAYRLPGSVSQSAKADRAVGTWRHLSRCGGSAR